MKRVRAVLAVLVGVLAVVGLLVSIVAVWARNTVFDSSRVSGAVGLALEEPEVIDGLATRITDQVFQAVDVESRLEGLLPPALAPLAPAIEGGVYSRVHARVAGALSTDAAKSIITGTVERAHSATMDLLNGEGLVDGITVQDGEVTVNLLPLLTLGLTSLQNAGLLDNVTVPQFTIDGDPAAQIAELEAAVGRDLADDFGQIVVYRSDALASAGQTLSNAQRTLVIVKRSLVGVMVLTVVCFVGSVLLAVRRRRALVVLSLASVAMLVVARAIINKVIEEVPLIALNPSGRAALATMVVDLTDGLVQRVDRAGGGRCAGEHHRLPHRVERAGDVDPREAGLGRAVGHGCRDRTPRGSCHRRLCRCGGGARLRWHRCRPVHRGAGARCGGRRGTVVAGAHRDQLAVPIRAVRDRRVAVGQQADDSTAAGLGARGSCGHTGRWGERSRRRVAVHPVRDAPAAGIGDRGHRRGVRGRAERVGKPGERGNRIVR